MIEPQIEEFFSSIGCPIELLFKRRPRGCSEDEILKGAEIVFDDLYSYTRDDFIKIPKEIFRLAKSQYVKRDITNEQHLKKDVELWIAKYNDLKISLRYCLVLCGLLTIATIYLLYWG